MNFDFSALDDKEIIGNIHNVQGSPLNPVEAFTHNNFMSKGNQSFYRPMVTISFMIDALLGGDQPWIYHLSNLILHLLTVIILFLFLKKIGIREEISFLLTLFYSIHPLLTNAVAWIPARGDILLCLFSLLSVITLLEYFNKRKIVYLILHAIVFIISVFSKETAIFLPFLILLYLYMVQKKEFNLKEIFPVMLIWCSSLALFYYLRLSVLKTNLPSDNFGIVPFIRNLPLIPITFGKFFFPYYLCTMPFYDTLSTIIGLVLLVVLAVSGIKYLKNEKRMMLFAATWFLSFSIPPMLLWSYKSDFGYEYFDYRAYLPVIGILIIAGLYISRLMANVSFDLIIKFSVPVLLIYSTISFKYLKAYADPMSFFTSAIEFSSKNAIALNSRGYLYLNSGKIEPAMHDFDNAIKISPTLSGPYFNKGCLYYSMNDMSNAEHFFSLSLKYDTLYPESSILNENAYIYLLVSKKELGKYDDMIALLKKAAAIYPNNDQLFNLFGLAYFYTKDYESAISKYNLAIQLQPGSFVYFNNRGKARVQIKDFKGALFDFNKAIELKPDFIEAHQYSGVTKIIIADYDGAISEFNYVIGLNPSIAEAYYNRGLAYSKINKNTEAEKDWEKARELGWKESITKNK